MALRDEVIGIDERPPTRGLDCWDLVAQNLHVALVLAAAGERAAVARKSSPSG